MRKLLLVFSVFLLLVGCSSSASSDDFDYGTLKGQQHIIKEVTYDDIKQKEKDKETYFLMIGRPSCGICVDSILPYSQEAEKSGIKEVYYFSFEDMFQQGTVTGKLDAKNEEAYEYLGKYLDFDGATPMFYYIKDGKLVFNSSEVDSKNLSSWNELFDKFFKEATNK